MPRSKGTSDSGSHLISGYSLRRGGSLREEGLAYVTTREKKTLLLDMENNTPLGNLRSKEKLNSSPKVEGIYSIFKGAREETSHVSRGRDRTSNGGERFLLLAPPISKAQR